MVQPIKVLHVIDSLAPGGAERVLIELVNGLFKIGCSVGVCVTRDNTQLAKQLQPDIPILVLERKHTWDLPALRQLDRFCRTHEVALLHAHGRSSMKLCALVKLLGGLTTKIVFHDHFGNIEVNKTVPLSIRFVSHRLVDHYIGVDPVLRNWAIEQLGLSSSTTSVVGNAIDLHPFSMAQPLARNDLYKAKQPDVGVIVANLKPQKDHLTLFKALATSSEARRRLHLLVIGLDLRDGYSQNCYDTVKELGLIENVTFLGSRLDIPRILQTADFGLLSSRSESGPVTLLEYMAASLPFIVTQTGQIAQLVHNYGLPYFVPPGDVTAYAACLDKLVNLSIQERVALGRQGEQLVSQLFNIDRQVELLRGIYQHLATSAWS